MHALSLPEKWQVRPADTYRPCHWLSDVPGCLQLHTRFFSPVPCTRPVRQWAVRSSPVGAGCGTSHVRRGRGASESPGASSRHCNCSYRFTACICIPMLKQLVSPCRCACICARSVQMPAAGERERLVLVHLLPACMRMAWPRACAHGCLHAWHGRNVNVNVNVNVNGNGSISGNGNVRDVRPVPMQCRQSSLPMHASMHAIASHAATRHSSCPMPVVLNIHRSMHRPRGQVCPM